MAGAPVTAIDWKAERVYRIYRLAFFTALLYAAWHVL